MLRLALASILVSLASLSVVACSGDDGISSIPESTPSGSAGDTADASSTARPDAAPPAVADAATTPTPPAETAPAPGGVEESGEATYYDANGTGACGFKPSNDFFVAAMNDEQYQKADCGKCVAVTGPKGTTVVRIVDKCPGCERGDLDLSMTAFSKIASLSDGRIKIKWHFVACP
jgi:expansin (peptidoglycan-binding protein)